MEIKSRLESVAGKEKWAARGASFVAKAKATKAVWFPPEPVKSGKKGASAATKATTSAAKKATGSTTAKAKNSTTKAKNSTSRPRNSAAKKPKRSTPKKSAKKTVGAGKGTSSR